MVGTQMLFVASLIIFGVALYYINMLWFSDERNRRLKGLFAMGLSMCMWMFFNALGMISGAESYPLIYTFRMLFIALNPFCALIFARDVTKSKFLSRPLVMTLSIVLPIIDGAFILTNGLHHLYFTAYTYPIAQLAPAFWIHYVISIVIWALAFVFLLRYFFKALANKHYIIVLAVVAFCPIFFNLMFTLPGVDLGHDFVPFVYFGAFAVFALFTNPSSTFNLQTGALADIVASSPDAYLVVDAHGVIADGNLGKFEPFHQLDLTPGETAEAWIDFLRGKAVGENETLFQGLSDPLNSFTEVEMTLKLSDADETDRLVAFTVTKKLMFHKNKYKGYVTILSDISEYKRMIDEINRQNEDLVFVKDEAEKASETKTNFLANMSHEMRTPLNAIIGLSQLELDEERMAETTRSNLEKINGSGMTLLNIINDILDISKIESGKFELIPVAYDMPSIINDTVTLNIMRIQEKPIDFKLNIDENLPSRLFGDELRLKQIFNNLLSNAFKYTREGSVEWSMHCEKDGDSMWMVSSVRDTGIGIREEDIKKLFSDYNQVDTKSNRTIEGTGLGLSITKQMVEKMDGEIRVESKYMEGTTFTVRLRQGYVTDVPIGRDIANSLMAFHYADKKRDKNQKMVRAQLPYARVLVVDDVQTNLDVARGMMKPYGMTVDCVTSGQKAIDLIRSDSVQYDAIFIDHMMPEMDGLEATKVIRENIGTEYAKTVPIIALTANAISGTEQMFLKNGFQAFLSKPIDIHKLDKVIKQWVRDKELEKELEEKLEAEQQAEAEKASVTAAGSAAAMGSESMETGAAGGILEGNTVDGVDLQRGLERFSGDAASYLEVVRSFVKNTPPLIEQMRGVNETNLPEFTVTVHGVKGSCYGICADPVGKMAEALEGAGRAGDFSFVAAQTEPFIEALEKLLSDLAAVLEQEAGALGKPMMKEPDEGLLTELGEACKNYDMDRIDGILSEIRRSEYENGGDLIHWIGEKIELSEFAEVHEKLSEKRDFAAAQAEVQEGG